MFRRNQEVLRECTIVQTIFLHVALLAIIQRHLCRLLYADFQTSDLLQSRFYSGSRIELLRGCIPAKLADASAERALRAIPLWLGGILGFVLVAANIIGLFFFGRSSSRDSRAQHGALDVRAH